MWQVQGVIRTLVLEVGQIIRRGGPAIANFSIPQLAVQAAQAGIIIHRTPLDTLNCLIGLALQVQNGKIFPARRPPDVLFETDEIGGVNGRIGRQAETAVEFFRRWNESSLEETRRLVAQYETNEALRDAMVRFIAESSERAYVLY